MSKTGVHSLRDGLRLHCSRLSSSQGLTGIAVSALLCGSLTACSLEEIKIPAEELYTREFIKSFGLIDQSQDWSIVKSAQVNVAVPQNSHVRIYANHDGATQLLGDFTEVSGRRTLLFDCPKPVEHVYVLVGDYMEKIPLGGSLTVAESRAVPVENHGKDALDVKVENGYFWDATYIDPIKTVLPENDPRNINSDEISTDFSFVSNGQEVSLYPIYWNTTGQDVLGVYWLENGRMMTKDLFRNYVADANGEPVKGADGRNIHNIYHRSRYLSYTTVPANNAVEVPATGTIEIKFNRHMKSVSERGFDDYVTFKCGDEVLRYTTNFTSPDNTLTFSYSDLPAGKTINFSLGAGCLETNTNLGKDAVKNPAINLEFTVVDNNVRLAEAKRTINSDGLSGNFSFTFSKAVKIRDSGALTVTPALTLENPVLSADKKTVTIGWSGASYSTTYTATVANDLVTPADPSNTLLTDWQNGFNGSANATFTTIDDPDAWKKDYEDTTPQEGVVFATDAIKSSEAKTSWSLMPESPAEDFPFESINALTNSVKELKTTEVTGGPLSFTTEGITGSVSFTRGVRSKSVKNTDDSFVPSADGNDYAVIEFKPTKDMLVTVYGFYTKSRNRYPLMWNETDGTLKAVGYSYANTEAPAGFFGTWAKYILQGGKTYRMFIDSNAAGMLCGFSYQTKKASAPSEGTHRRKLKSSRLGTVTVFSNHDLPTDSRSSRAYEDINDILGINGTIPEQFMTGGVFDASKVESTSFVRNSQNKGEALDPNGNDEVITHKVSFTLPKDVLFGFYLYNQSGAANITGPGDNPNSYVNYSMSARNRTQPSSFFNRLDETKADYKYFEDGWGSGDGKHDELKDPNGKFVKVPADRKYSTAALYTINIEGQDIRYFSFEDWCDYDFNDIAFLVAPRSEQSEIIDMDKNDTNPYIFAVEDLGATDESDIDFNDIVFAVEHVAGDEHAFVTVLAAGGIYPMHLFYNGREIGNGFGEIVDGPHAGRDLRLSTVHQWFVDPKTNYPCPDDEMINTGQGVSIPFGNLTTIRIPVDPATFNLTELANAYGNDADISRIGFSVKVERPDGTTDALTRPSKTGQAPQMILLPRTWQWPTERTQIHDAYPDFEKWVTDGDGQSYENLDWHKNVRTGYIYDSLWEGSEAARAYRAAKTETPTE